MHRSSHQIAYLAAHILRDALSAQPLPEGCTLMPISPGYDANHLLPVGLKIRLPGWTFLNTSHCRYLLRELHETAERSYRQLRETFTGSPDANAAWTRPHLLPVDDVSTRLDELAWLGAHSRRDLLRLRRALRDVTADEVAFMKEHPKIANRCLSLGDLSYTLTLITPTLTGPDLREAPEVILVMQVKLISYVGHAPAVGPAVASIIDRHHGPVMDDALLASRRTFHEEYLTRLCPAPMIVGG